MPVLPFRRKFKPPANEEQLEADRGARQAEQFYAQSGYSQQSAQEQAEQDFQLAQAIKKRRGLKNIKLTGVSN